ncbi:hypothetical protein K7574_02165 [Stenotrophomonas maltophilia]|uniref:hypothetical protein n=1 Tax=Stenotrophomonas maltophilia TaxID=40324 RepID=UPI000D46555A|nr:hypothetical protein [Stenotrophomonas maltophilia]PSD33761.1 hypothetical protein C7E17_00500 [Stenotrophomonas maltophilia]UXF72887.1 hypothetical protein K7574_02165 [Stenotrophomonas maltophilia]
MAAWQFRTLNPNENSGSSISDDNFSIEERTNVEILVRETLQNPLDARSSVDDQVKVSYRIVEVDLAGGKLASDLFSDLWLEHAKAGQLLQRALPRKARFLLIEDFGTTGLEGAYTDSSVDGSSENWNAFWFREGEGAKHARANGGAGQGKITLYLASEVRTVIALTKRKSDGKELLFGCSRFLRNYRLVGKTERWAKEARWGSEANPDKQGAPIVDRSLIEALKHELGLSRRSEAGTSFIVPLPQENLTEDGIRTAVINEFFFAISRGRLEVTVGEAVLNESSIAEASAGLAEASRQSTSFREFLRMAAGKSKRPALATAKPGWHKGFDESSFEPTDLTNLKDAFELGAPIVVDLPLSIKTKRGVVQPTTFRVFLQSDEELERSEELFIRQDLAIDGEKKLKSVRATQPVLALTFIDDQNLSEFLVCAEEPTHRTWNAQRPKVKNAYMTPNVFLAAVRNAAAKLVQLVAPVGQRDQTALAVYFADPAQAVKVKKGPSGDAGSKERPGDVELVEIPAPKPKPVSFKPGKDGFTVRAHALPDSAFVPLECRVETGYATVHGDPFRLWDAADFWLDDSKRFRIDASGIADLTVDGNELRFRMEKDDASIAVRGFDENRQLEVRLKYKEVADEADIAQN